MDCAFGGCRDSANDGHQYCLHHLKYLTKVNVERAVFELVLDELGVDATEVTPRARFIDDLGADSIDSVELVMRLEEVFHLDIPPGDAEKIQSVGDTINYVTDCLLAEPVSRFILHLDVDLEAVRQSVEQNPENVARQLMQIVQSPLFQDYFSRLKLETSNVERIFRIVVRDNWIDHVTTVPEFDKVSKALTNVSVIILCRRVIYYFTLRVKSVAFTSFPLAELKLAYQVNYCERGEVSEVEVSGGSRSIQGTDQSFTFKTQEGVDGALSFLDKCLHNMESLL